MTARWLQGSFVLLIFFISALQMRVSESSAQPKIHIKAMWEAFTRKAENSIDIDRKSVV